MTVILPEMHLFTKDYYEDGIRKHISGYEEYKWMPTRSIPEALDILDKFDFYTCVDYGSAKGFSGSLPQRCAVHEFPCTPPLQKDKRDSH